MTRAKNPVPEGFHTVTPQLTLDNTAQALDWYKKALGAEEISRAQSPDGKIMHAEIRIGDSRIMLTTKWEAARAPAPTAARRRRCGCTSTTATRCSTARFPRERKSTARWASCRFSSGATARARSTIRTATPGRLPHERKI